MLINIILNYSLGTRINACILIYFIFVSLMGNIEITIELWVSLFIFKICPGISGGEE